MRLYAVYRQARGADVLECLYFSEQKATRYCNEHDWCYTQELDTKDEPEVRDGQA